MNSDFSDLLKLFNANGVRYLVVGGYAFGQHAEPRYTKDLDVWVDTDRENAHRVFKALAAFGAPLSGITIEDFEDESNIYQIGVAPVRIDVIMSVKGLGFEEAWKNRVEATYADMRIPFLSKEDLITSKLAAGRPQDLVDVRILTATERPSRPTRKKRRPPERKRRNGPQQSL